MIPRNKGVMERSLVLVSCGRGAVPEESIGQAVGERTVKLQWRPQHFGDASAWGNSQGQHHGWSGSWLEPVMQTVCASDSRAREVEPARPLGAHKIMSKSQLSPVEPLTPLDFGFALI